MDLFQMRQLCQFQIITYILAQIDNDFGTWAGGFSEGMSFFSIMSGVKLDETMMRLSQPDKLDAATVTSELYHAYVARDQKRSPFMTEIFEKAGPFLEAARMVIERMEADAKSKKIKH